MANFNPLYPPRMRVLENLLETIQYNFSSPPPSQKMTDAKTIRRNRDQMRTSLKQKLSLNGFLSTRSGLSPTGPAQGFESMGGDGPERRPAEEPAHTSEKLRRKTSLDIKILGNSFDMFECNEVYTYYEFSELYETLGKIDEGMESVVYEAVEKRSGNRFAVKVFRKKDQDIINRIKSQFRILKNLEHPNVIKAYNLFVNERVGISHLILQYCQSPNLRFHLLKNRTLKQTEIAEILSGILSAVAFLHAQGICHRDIKPENILFNPATRQVKLIDFEIAKMIKYSHQKLEMMTSTGTLYYKAPEMFDQAMYGQLVDVWAVGIIAYEMISGHLPFNNLYEGEVIRQIREKDPKYNMTNVTDLCLNFVRRCLEKDPLRRFTAFEALKSPFILKYSSISSCSNSSPMRRKNSEDHMRNIFEIEVSRCLDEDSDLKNVDSLEIDNGIRLVVQGKNQRSQF